MLSQVMGCGCGSCEGGPSETPLCTERVFRKGLGGDPQLNKHIPFRGAQISSRVATRSGVSLAPKTFVTKKMVLP